MDPASVNEISVAAFSLLGVLFIVAAIGVTLCKNISEDQTRPGKKD